MLQKKLLDAFKNIRLSFCKKKLLKKVANFEKVETKNVFVMFDFV